MLAFAYYNREGVMLVAALKDKIQALPGEQFVKTWECIEEIKGSLAKAGPNADLALSYIQAVHITSKLAQLEKRIGKPAKKTKKA